MKVYLGPAHSGNSHKIRILVGLAGIDIPVVALSLREHEHKSAEFLKINPRGQAPALVDGDLVLWDSSAILVHLARRFAPAFLPEERMAEIVNWLCLAAGEIQFGLQYGRRGRLRGSWVAGDAEQTAALGRIAVGAVSRRLSQASWLVGDTPTIADIACFPYLETASQSGVDLDGHEHVKAWIGRCLALPGWPQRNAFAF